MFETLEDLHRQHEIESSCRLELNKKYEIENLRRLELNTYHRHYGTLLTYSKVLIGHAQRLKVDAELIEKAEKSLIQLVKAITVDQALAYEFVK